MEKSTPLAQMIRMALDQGSVPLHALGFRGAEGDGDGGSTPPPAPPGGDDPPEGEDEDGEEDKDSFSREYVEKLRKEAADNRVKRKEAEEKLKEKERAEMSEVERSKAEAEDEKARAAELEAEVKGLKLDGAIKDAAIVAKFNNPTDAVAFVDKSALSMNDDGTPNKNSLEAAIAKLVKERPYLVRSPGSGDGGGPGGAPSDKQMQDSLKAHADKQVQRGGVKVS